MNDENTRRLCDKTRVISYVPRQNIFIGNLNVFSNTSFSALYTVHRNFSQGPKKLRKGARIILNRRKLYGQFLQITFHYETSHHYKRPITSHQITKCHITNPPKWQNVPICQPQNVPYDKTSAASPIAIQYRNVPYYKTSHPVSKRSFQYQKYQFKRTIGQTQQRQRRPLPAG